MNKLIIITLFFTSFIFAQKIEIGNIENQLKTYNYVLNNLDNIKSNNEEEILYVTLNFNKNHFIEKSSFFSCNKQTLNDENKKEIKVSDELNQFIEKTFSFFSNDIFYSKQNGESRYSFFIPLSKKDLEIGINNITNEIHNLEHNSDKKGIIANSKFNLQLTDLYFNRKKYDDKKDEGKLNNLNSQLIEIAPNLYFIFRIIKTNQFVTNKAVDFFEYKIMYLEGTSSELFISNRFKIDSKEIEIDEIPLSSADDNLSDSPYCESDEIENSSRKFENIKFSIKLQFVK
nr:hypothetical protein [uncultured Flavobacterium sp.]